MTSFTDMKVWQKAHALTLALYKMTASFPPEEKFGLTSQIRRAAVSVEANLAEGCKRKTRIDFARFVNMSEGSAEELKVLILIGKDLGFVRDDDAKGFSYDLDEISRMLYAFRNKLETTE